MENCRVCLKAPDSSIQLSQEYKKKFFQITGVELDETKKEILCKKCFGMLLVVLKFRKEAIEADEWFRKQDPDVDDEVFLEEELKPELKFEVFIEEGQVPIQLEKETVAQEKVLKKYIPKPKDPYICYFCEEKFRRYQDILAHMKIHKKERRHTCRCCDKFFADKVKLANHERSYRRKQSYSSSLVCQHCGSVYSDVKGLAMHARIHTGNLNLKCTIDGCTEAFREKRAYYRHFITSHGIKRPCVCTDCGTSYSNHISLRTHRRMYHNDQSKLHKCPECPDKKFLTKANLDDHIAFKHRGERNHVCSACPKSYGNPKNLRRHFHDNHHELYLEMIRKGKFRKNVKISS